MSKEKFEVRTVFNHDNDGHKTGGYEIFMDEFLGLYDTINVRYPEIDDLYKLQRSCIWTEDEINLEQSRMDMLPIGKGGKTRQEEIDILTKAVSYLWEADSVASRSVLGIFAPYITNSEATAMFTIHTLLEIIHSASYSEIVRQCNMNPRQLIDETVKNEEITGRMNLITESFDNLIYMGSHYSIGSDKYTKKEHRQALIRALMSLYLLERVQFMSSFVVVFGLAEHDKFKGIADIVRLIARDEHCMTGDHEVLTTNGWVRIEDLKEGVEIAQWDYESGNISFVKPYNIIHKKYTGDMYHITHPRNYIDQFVTEDHRIPLVYNDGKPKCKVKETTAKDLKVCTGAHHIPVSGLLNGVNFKSELSDIERLLIAFQADGTLRIMPKGNIVGKHTNKFAVLFAFHKERKVERMESLLERLGYEYSKNLNKGGQVKFYIKVPMEYYDVFKEHGKTLEWVDLTDKNYQWCREFLEEVEQWDSHTRSEDTFVYCTTKTKPLDMVRTIAHLAGYLTFVGVTEAHERYTSKGEYINASEYYRLTIMKSKSVSNGRANKKEKVYVEDLDVYCVTVPSSFFMVRRNGVISITGNCHATMISTVLNIIRRDNKDWDDDFNELLPEILDMVDEVVQHEFRWNEYLFSEGRSMVGLNAPLLNEWVLWCTKDLCDRINIPYNYKVIKENPLSWTDNWFEFDAIQNANQEADNTNYRLNAVENDLDEEEVFDI